MCDEREMAEELAILIAEMHEAMREQKLVEFEKKEAEKSLREKMVKAQGCTEKIERIKVKLGEIIFVLPEERVLNALDRMGKGDEAPPLITGTVMMAGTADKIGLRSWRADVKTRH